MGYAIRLYLSVALCALSLSCSYRSTIFTDTAAHSFRGRRSVSLVSCDGALYLMTDLASIAGGAETVFRSKVNYPRDHVENPQMIEVASLPLGLKYRRDPHLAPLIIGVPFWLIALTSAAFAIDSFRRSRKARRGLPAKTPQHACRKCGYDLRTQKSGLAGDKCPECGTPIPAPPGSASRSPPAKEV